MNVNKMAKRDAREQARARMFYGEGAGTRRKLINAQVEQRLEDVPGYRDAFFDALAKQDMACHAMSAKRERQLKDTQNVIERNVRGITTGNKRALSPALGVAFSVWVVAQQTGADKHVKTFAKAKTKKVQDELKIWRAKRKLKKAF